MEFSIKEIEVAKLNLKPGDSLIVTVKSDKDLDNLNSLGDYLEDVFNKNRVILLGMGSNDEVKFTVVREPKVQVQNFCVDCSCGKKEQYESNEGQ